MELKVGLHNLEIFMPDNDIQVLWTAFEKLNTKISFFNFYNRFLTAGALKIFKFDESLEKLLKKFSSIVKKYGNNEEFFRKLDYNKSGQISLMEFRSQCKRLHLGMTNEEIDLLFKSFCQSDNVPNSRKIDLPPDEFENKKKTKTFGYKQLVKLLSQYKSKDLTVN